jgi:ankyrin repeat protein
VVAIDTTRDPAFDRDEILEDPLEVLSICSSLVTLTTVSKDDRHDRPFDSQRIIALAHYSVQEYLVSDRIKQGEAKQYSLEAVTCHDAIMQDCLHYLLQFQQLETRPSIIINKFALARYSAIFWSSHVQETGGEIAKSRQLILDLLSSGNPAYVNWIRLYDHPRTIVSDTHLAEEGCDMPQPLYCAAMLGESRVVEILLEAGANVNAAGGYYGSTLQAAFFEGADDDVIKALLKAGADVNRPGRYYYSALQAAAWSGDEKVVQMFLEAGAKVDEDGGDDGSALEAALDDDNHSMVQTLLEAGADPNTQVEEYGNVLQLASFTCSNAGIVELLLRAGAKVNAQGGHFGSALRAASCVGDDKIVEILLEAGAEVNAQGGYYGNALQAAIDCGQGQIVKMLVEAGAENKDTVPTRSHFHSVFDLPQVW